MDPELQNRALYLGIWLFSLDKKAMTECLVRELSSSDKKSKLSAVRFVKAILDNSDLNASQKYDEDYLTHFLSNTVAIVKNDGLLNHETGYRNLTRLTCSSLEFSLDLLCHLTSNEHLSHQSLVVPFMINLLDSLKQV